MSTYATVADARAAARAQLTIDDNVLYQALRVVSRRIDTLMASARPVFEPTTETRRFRAYGHQISSWDNTLNFDGGLLELTGVTAGTQALTTGTQVEAWPAGMPPFRTLRLIDEGASWWTYCTTSTAPLVIAITGIWGLHAEYAAAWASVDALAAGINASVTTLTVADVDGIDEYGLTPRLSTGALIRVDDELMEVIATNTATNVATVRRGANGSTAAAHNSAAAVRVWRPDVAVRHVTARQAGLLVSRRGSYDRMGTGEAEANYPTDLLQELVTAVGAWRYGY